ncbi:MAG TPA: M48 family metallopeptidase [Oligoflexia bacterium]|nr:M48 family metallopeptidase [Oligoflexia bacterium]HMP27391.1 M48 family metallopeptidase [Oligoflexia bacterium]
MDFFEHQEQAKKRTTFFLLVYAVVLLFLVVASYFLLIFALPSASADKLGWLKEFSLWQPHLFLICLIAHLGIVSLGAAWKFFILGEGGDRLAMALGGEPINPVTRDQKERKLLNIVEEMSIASGVVVPRVFLLKKETSINAFAAGLDPNRAVIGITKGALEQLNRDELQGVVAHEFSHILNGDMRLNLKMIGILHGLLLIALIGRFFYEIGTGSDKEYDESEKWWSVFAFFGIGLFAIGYVGVFASYLIKAAVSRQREFLADAAAVQFTRNPDGIAGALTKIKNGVGGEIKASQAEVASHMYFSRGVSHFFYALFSTHPPISERISKIRGFFSQSAIEQGATVEYEPLPVQEGAVSFAVPLKDKAQNDLLPKSTPIIDSEITLIGTTNDRSVSKARAYLEQLPEELVDACHNIFGARAVVISLLINHAESQGAQSVLESQLDGILEPFLLAEVLKVQNIIKRDFANNFDSELKLVLLELALPTLYGLSLDQYRQFKGYVEKLINLDQKLDFFEFIMAKIIFVPLKRYFKEQKDSGQKYQSLDDLSEQALMILAAVSLRGKTDIESAWKAFERGASVIAFKSDREFFEKQKKFMTLIELGAALDKLALAAPLVKKQFLAGVIAATNYDGFWSDDQKMLYRAIATTLSCPIPLAA